MRAKDETQIGYVVKSLKSQLKQTNRSRRGKIDRLGRKKNSKK
jgi:hypothetical protein